jgi:DNA-binding NarL/FixJ family response regulator
MKILLVDHHILFREGIASLLMHEPEIEIVGAVGSIQQAAKKLSDFQPDLILMEFGEDVTADLLVVQNITTYYPNCLIVLLSNREPDDILVEALRVGIKGYIPKDSSFDKVMASIRGLERGEMALSRSMTRRAIDMLFLNQQDRNLHMEIFDSLTSRELDVLKIMASGASNRAIAERLSISENTVKIHVHKILKKLGVRNRREAARLANQNSMALTLNGTGEHSAQNGDTGKEER